MTEAAQAKLEVPAGRAKKRRLKTYPTYRDSGVGWLGQVPEHWDVCRTKFVARLESGHTPSRQHPEYWVDCAIPWFSLADVWHIRDGKTEYVNETAEKVSELGIANSSARLLPKGIVIVSRTASVEFSAILGVDAATTQDFVNWVCGNRTRPEYLLYVFRGMRQEFRRLTMGSTHQTICFTSRAKPGWHRRSRTRSPISSGLSTTITWRRRPSCDVFDNSFATERSA